MKIRWLAFFAACLSMVAGSAGATPKSSNPMKIGIIGTGEIGGALARHWAAAGHQLLISSRHPEELQALAKELGPNVKVGTPREAAAFRLQFKHALDGVGISKSCATTQDAHNPAPSILFNGDFRQDPNPSTIGA